MAQPAQAQSAAPANSKSAQPSAELDYSKPIQLDGIESPFPIGNDQKKGLRAYPVEGGFRAGTIDGVVKRIQFVPQGIEIQVQQRQTGIGRKQGAIYFVLITQSGMVCEVSNRE